MYPASNIKMDHHASVAVIDDIEINRKFIEYLSKTVTEIDEVHTFSSPESALEKFKTQKPDLIITDFSMPTMDAAVFLQKLRTITGLEETPVIVVSANENIENRRRALLCGATDFLTTPFDIFEFKVRVRNLLCLGLHQNALRTDSISLKQKLTETRLRSIKSEQKSRERFTRVIDCVPAIIVALKGDGECIFANEYFKEVIGGYSKYFIALLGQMSISYGAPSEVTLKNRNGQDCTFLIMASVVHGSHTEEGFVVYSGIDVSTLKQTEQSLRIAKCQAEAANQAKSAFLANISHEVRTPLNAIIGFADLIRSETFGPVQNARYRGYIDDIFRSAKHLLSIISEILSFSQIEQGKHSLSLTEFSLRDCIEGVRRMIEAELQSRGNSLLIDSRRDFKLRSDPQKLSQVIINIITNANRFTKKGEIRIEVSKNRQAELMIAIEDQGIGMTDEELGIAVSDFGRIVNPELSNSDQGIGLGIPISARFMRLLGGRLEITSKKGIGTRVDLILPSSAVVEQHALPAMPLLLARGS